MFNYEADAADVELPRALESRTRLPLPSGGPWISLQLLMQWQFHKMREVDPCCDITGPVRCVWSQIITTVRHVGMDLGQNFCSPATAESLVHLRVQHLLYLLGNGARCASYHFKHPC